MSTPVVDSLVASVIALRDRWMAAGGDVRAMSEADLLALNSEFASVRRLLDGAFVPVAAEMAARSRPEFGRAGLARKAGHRTPAKLIASGTGGHVGEALRLIQVGEATREHLQLSGEVGPAAHPHVAAALATGAVSVAAAAAITGMLDRIAVRVAAGVRDAAEKTMVEHAATLALDDLQAVLRRAEAHLDPDGLEPAVAEMRGERSVRIWTDRAGMTAIDARLGPEGAAPVIAVLEAFVTHQLRVSRGRHAPDGFGVEGGAGATGRAEGGAGAAGGAGGGAGAAGSAGGDAATAEGGAAGGPAIGSVMPETRTLAQLRADALTEICRHALAADPSELPGSATTTVVVRMTLADLQREDGGGLATIDGIEQPIDTGTARRLAARAEIIPCVLGGDSEILDWGRAKRHFTRAQRLALVERDGGCASCHLPPAFTEAHHLRWWLRHRGPTDLSNGILLCSACHHRIHDEGWEIRIQTPPGAPPSAGVVWFIPPPHVDPARTPRMGGRRASDPLTWNLAA